MTSANPQKKPVSLNLVAGLIFLPIAIISLAKGEYFEFIVWVSIGVAMVLADMHYLPKGANMEDIPATPKWRTYLSIALMAIGMAAFGYIVGRDVKAKYERSSSVVANEVVSPLSAIHQQK